MKILALLLISILSANVFAEYFSTQKCSRTEYVLLGRDISQALRGDGHAQINNQDALEILDSQLYEYFKCYTVKYSISFEENVQSYYLDHETEQIFLQVIRDNFTDQIKSIYLKPSDEEL